MQNKECDILIIGGGLTGATLMLALQDLGYSTCLVESNPFSSKTNPDFDARSLALSPASRSILNTLGVWQVLQEYATPIHLIHVSDQNRFGASRLHGDANNPLGYVVEMQYINLALHTLLQKQEVIAPATFKSLDIAQGLATVQTASGELLIKAKLIVAADGADSAVRQICQHQAQTKQYQQQAIIANIGLAKPHDYKAYERFTAQGPLALLPMQGNKMSLVWAMDPNEAARLIALEEGEFLQALQLAFGYRLGRFIKLGKRFCYPLKQVLMPKQTKWPVVYVGNAAHTLHPVAGQGFNLGLRDVATLAQNIAQFGLNENMLAQYAQARHHDQQIITHLTDGLITLFTSRLPGVGIARNIGLIAFDNLPVLKNLLARYARGYGGVTPDLVCEIALQPRKSL